MGKGPLKDFLSTLATLVIIGALVVALVSSGGWRALSRAFHIGDPDAATSSLTESKGSTEGNPDAQPLPDLLRSIVSDVFADPDAATDADKTTTGDADAATGDGDATAPDAATTSEGADEWRHALDLTGTIETAKARQGGYDREEQFGGWASAGCGKATTRDTILARDLTGVERDRDCRVTSGTLADPYTGETIAFQRGVNTSAAVQIDHVVALQDAWASGARDWTQEKRVEYANSPDVLMAVDGPQNMAKGAGLDFNGTSRWLTQHTSTPDIWMPENEDYRCDYLSRRVEIKSAWGLTMTPREKQQTVTMLASCVAGR